MAGKQRYYGKPRQTLPHRHDHAGHMLWEDDFCCCRVCEQAWTLTEKGWKALPRQKVPTFLRD